MKTHRRARRDLNGEAVADVEAVEVDLNSVLVVHELPVPLHISVKAKPEELGTGAFDFIPGDINMDGMRKESFPERYQDHPYWEDNGVVYVGAAHALGAVADGVDAA